MTYDLINAMDFIDTKQKLTGDNLNVRYQNALLRNMVLSFDIAEGSKI